jgi:hypothetical protein
MNIRKMVLGDGDRLTQLPDSCVHFSFRGITVKQGFKPGQ